MHSTLFISILAGLGGMIGWGTADFFAKKTIDKIGDLITLFWQQLFGCVPLLIAFLISPDIPHINQFDPMILLAFGVISALSYLVLYSAFGKGQISLISPIFASYSVVVVILSVIILGQKLSAVQTLAIIVTFIGIVLISTDVKDLKHSFKKRAFKLAGLPEVLTAVLVYSFWLLYLDKFLNGKQWLFYLLVIRVISTLTLLVYAGLRHISLRVTDSSLWKYLVCIGVFDVAAYSFVSYGFSHTQYPSIIAVLTAAFSLPTMLLAYLFLGEKISRSQLAAAGIILSGIVLITLT